MKWTNKGHQFDAYGKIFTKKKRILIYGAGEEGEKVYKKIRFLNCIDGFIDRDLVKQKSGLCGLPVFTPTVILDEHKEEYLIIVGMNAVNANEICKKLFLAGYIEGVDYWRWESFCADNILAIYWLYTQNKVYLSSSCVIPSTVCNLNCEKCLNFTYALNKSQKHIVKNLADVQNEIDLIFGYVDFTPRFQISGGEPILYKYFAEVVEYIGENYRERIGEQFETVLNGTKIPSANLIELFKRYDMLIIVDDYTINVPSSAACRAEIFNILDNSAIRYNDNKVEQWFDLSVDMVNNETISEKERIEYFDKCGNPWNYFEDNRINACNFANFAHKAGVMLMQEDEYLEMKRNPTLQDKKEFVEFVLGFNAKGYVNLCLRCAGWSSINKNFIPVARQIAERCTS